MQGQLGVNRERPILTVQTFEDEKVLCVYVGFLYYSSVPNDRSSVQYRLLVGQLALAGFAIVQLMEVFGFSRPTIMRYKGIVANSSDEQEMFKQLRGGYCEKSKLTLDVEVYIRTRFQAIYPRNRGSYNRQLREEVFKQFRIELSAETVRQVIAPLRRELDSLETVDADCAPSVEESWERDPFKEATSSVESRASVMAELEEADVFEIDSPDRLAAEKTSADGQLHLYAGLLVLNLSMGNFMVGFKSWGSTFLQWFYQIFAGAVNFEQSRYMSRGELSQFIGKTAVSVSQSRSLLKEFAHHHPGHRGCLQFFLEVNLNCVATHLSDKSNYFYIDGHFDPYYGKIGILKGWSCIFNRAMKGSNHYAIHDVRGYPFIKELKDCFEDFRFYLKDTVEKLKGLMPAMPIGIIFDRGGFSEEILVYFETQGVFFITWEKHFSIDKEGELDFGSVVIIEREINEVGKFREIVFECAETTYSFGKDDQCRKLVIGTEKEDEDGQKKLFYASILTNDSTLTHQQIVELMSGRWGAQENDFRYQKKHFGLDQITSYDALPSPIAGIQPLIDEQNGELKALKVELLEKQIQQQKLYEGLGIKRLTPKAIQRLEKEVDQHPKKYEMMLELRALKPQLQKLSGKCQQIEKKIQRLERIEAKGYRQLDYRKKAIFDHLRFTARNIFYTAITDFKEHYTNLRDLHVVFWKLVRSVGYIKYGKQRIVVTLYCPFFEGKVQQAVKDFLQKLNEKEPILLDGTKRKIVFRVNS